MGNVGQSLSAQPLLPIGDISLGKFFQNQAFKHYAEFLPTPQVLSPEFYHRRILCAGIPNV